ncbi:MAG: NAD-dependent succinate-semialdehyde dehydrogenase [Verrucomicrobiota bacterium]
MPFVSINPADDSITATFRGHTRAEIDILLSNASETFASWSQFPPARRAACIRRIARTLRTQTDRLATLITAEMGKPITEARAEVRKCADCCDFYAQHGSAFLRAERPPGAPTGVRIHHEPLGPILAIMPWDFPFWQVFRATIPALAAGNTVLLKHASNVTGCARAIERLALDAGLPPGALNVLVTDGRAAGRLIADPRVRGVTLTGSTAAGRKVAALAGQYLKPCVLELGGSDPYLILADADLEHAADVCTAARLLNNGQSCISAKRLIVDHSVVAAFEKKLVERFAARRVGPPADESTQQGPMARADLRDELHAQVTASRRRGARLLLGGKPTRGPGCYYPPSVLSDVRPGQPAFDEELFGPVAAIIAAEDEEDAIRLANDTPYGLGAAVFSRDVTRARRLAQTRLHAGTVFVNGQVKSDPRVPFGGINDSGFGRELGRPGLMSFVNAKTVWTE